MKSKQVFSWQISFNLKTNYGSSLALKSLTESANIHKRHNNTTIQLAILLYSINHIINLNKIDNHPESCNKIAEHYGIDGELFERQYRNHLSGYKQWDQIKHAEDWILFERNMGTYIAIDEVFCPILHFSQKEKTLKAIDFQDFPHFYFSCLWCHQKVNVARFTIDNHRFIFSSAGKSTRFGTRLFFIVLPVVLARLLVQS